MYLMTHSLLSSWQYLLNENKHEAADSDPLADFLRVLNRQPTETTEAMQKGIDFENLVTAIVNNTYNSENPKWYTAAEAIANIVAGGQLQFVAKKKMQVSGIDILLYGRLDALKAGEVYDIKFSSGYERGKFIDSTQHPVYLELIPEAAGFTYLISNGSEVWTERYRRDETADIRYTISCFFSWLESANLMEVYQQKWQSKSRQG